MISSFFDASKRYKEVIFREGQFIASEDFNLVQDMDNHDKRELFKYLEGFQLKINALVNSPVLKVRANNDLVEGQVVDIEVVDASNVRWRKNGGAWSGSVAVTFNNVTWNTIGTSGIDAVLKTSPTAGDQSEVWVSQAMRLLGGAVDSTAPGTFRLTEGKWSILGEFEAFDASLSAVGCADDDYLFVQVTNAVVDYTADNTLGHRLADGQYSDKSPEAVQRQYALLSGATVPANTAIPYVQNIIVGKVVSAAGGTFIEMWDTPFDVQQFLRIYAHTTAPVAPAGLTLSTGSDVNLVDVALMANRVSLPTPSLGYITMSCDSNDEPNIDYYEFKITRLASVGGALTADSIVQLVKNNTDAGGGMTVPLGISYTLHGQQFGIPYRVWVRAVDFAGNVGAWSASSDVVVGGSVSEIPAISAGPTFTLIDTEGFVGVTISVTGLPALAEGYSVWIGEGSYPNVGANEGFMGSYNANVGSVNIPWKENGRPYVRIKAFDQNGIYQTLVSEDNTHLAASAQLATSSHNESLASHGGVISDILTSQGPHGSVYRWLNLLSGQAWTPEGVYILAKSGSVYSSLEACFNTILSETPAHAVVFVMPGFYGGGATYSIPDTGTTRVDVVGIGNDTCYLSDVIDTTNVKPVLGTHPPALTFHNISFVFDIIGNSSSGSKKISFTNCKFRLGTSSDNIFTLTTSGAGSYVLLLENCFFFGDSVLGLCNFTGAVNFVFSDCLFVTGSWGQPCILLDTPTGSVRLLKNCAFQLPAGSTNYAIDALGVGVPYAIWAYGNAWNNAPPPGRVTVNFGTVDTNTVMPDGFLY